MGNLEDEGEDENVPPETTQVEAVTHARALVDEELELWEKAGLQPHAIGMPGLTIITNLQALADVLISKELVTEDELEVLRLTKMLEVLEFQRKEQEKQIEAAKRASLGLGPRLLGPHGEVLH